LQFVLVLVVVVAVVVVVVVVAAAVVVSAAAGTVFPFEMRILQKNTNCLHDICLPDITSKLL
jgi:hypothetical protein